MSISARHLFDLCPEGDTKTYMHYLYLKEPQRFNQEIFAFKSKIYKQTGFMLEDQDENFDVDGKTFLRGTTIINIMNKHNISLSNLYEHKEALADLQKVEDLIELFEDGTINPAKLDECCEPIRDSMWESFGERAGYLTSWRPGVSHVPSKRDKKQFFKFVINRLNEGRDAQLTMCKDFYFLGKCRWPEGCGKNHIKGEWVSHKCANGNSCPSKKCNLLHF